MTLCWGSGDSNASTELQGHPRGPWGLVTLCGKSCTYRPVPPATSRGWARPGLVRGTLRLGLPLGGIGGLGFCLFVVIFAPLSCSLVLCSSLQ